MKLFSCSIERESDEGAVLSTRISSPADTEPGSPNLRRSQSLKTCQTHLQTNPDSLHLLTIATGFQGEERFRFKGEMPLVRCVVILFNFLSTKRNLLFFFFKKKSVSIFITETVATVKMTSPWNPN